MRQPKILQNPHIWRSRLLIYCGDYKRSHCMELDATNGDK